MPANQKYDSKTGLAGGVTEADYEKLVTENLGLIGITLIVESQKM
ncbi:MAG: hypothetical protein CM15mV19_1140 [uncultured marine virus]|nr:MAG: hypothetical protein CM15mV19_1140 [uncultured marine virus]